MFMVTSTTVTPFEEHILNTSNPLMTETEEWAASAECDTNRRECRQIIAESSRTAYALPSQLAAFETM